VRPLWAIAAAGCVLVAGAASASPAPSGEIVFAANRLPHWFGEIYRVTAAGRHIDLTRSAAPDIGPSVSPDGKWVAFLSARGGHWAFYVVSADGQGLRRISRPIFALVPNESVWAQIAWAPDSRTIAAELGGERSALYLGTLESGLRLSTRAVLVNSWAASLGWSRDGRLLAYTTPTLVRVVDATGKRLWWAPGSIGPSAWSADGKLAVSANSHTVTVYDGSGRARSSFAGTAPAWDPTGTLLASAGPFSVQVRRNGRSIMRWPIRNAGSLQWVNATTLRFQGPNGWIGVDVAHKRASSLVRASTPYDSVVAASGRVLAEAFVAADGAKLVLGGRTLATAPCGIEDGDFAGLAFMPRALGVVYQTACYVPSADLYAVRPDGSGLRQITHTAADEIQPSISPDGNSIAYVQQATAGKCDGCAQTLWRVPAAGGAPQQLTSHSDADAAPFDQSPTWSPDGSEIAFQRSGAVVATHLLVMPAAGGAARNLHAKGAAFPEWGRRLIAYADWSVPHISIKTLDPATGATQTVQTGGKSDVQALAWSRDGRLAYLYFDANGHALVGVVGSSAAPLDLGARLPPNARVAGLAWSPDGTRFAFAATGVDGNADIYTIGVDGTGLRQVTHDLGAVYAVPQYGTISWRRR
jgi:Tol biopolymer transport system component